MITQLIERFMAKQTELKELFAKDHPDSYIDIVRAVIEAVTTDEHSWKGDNPDPQRIHTIDDGEYQGVLLYVIAAKGYQPSDYWYVKVGYGSCSGCDTLESIRGYSSEPPTEEQISDYLTLALHIAQGLKKMGEDYA